VIKGVVDEVVDLIRIQALAVVLVVFSEDFIDSRFDLLVVV
jgi:hypothetical protein